MDSYQLAWGVVLLAIVVCLTACFVALVYISARAAALAWYRTRYDHIKKVMKSLGRNGDGLM